MILKVYSSGIISKWIYHEIKWDRLELRAIFRRHDAFVK